MAKINFTVNDHSIRVDNLIELAQASNNFDTCAFSFDNAWDGFTLYAVMYQNPKNVFKKPLDSANTCKIPVEVLKKSGWLYVGARGEKEDQTIATSVVIRFSVKDGAVDGNETGQEMLNESQYEYLLGKISQLSEEKASINQLSLGIYTDGLMYIFINGQPIGMGIEVGSSEPVIPESLDKISVVDGIMTILSLTNKPTQSGSILTIS